MEKVDEFINQMLAVEEARLIGYEEDPVVRTAFETNEKEVIWRTYYNDAVLGKVKVRDSEVRELYGKIVEQYHLAQIVVAEESLANYVYAEFEKGISFEDLLMFSLDTMSNNGDIGTFSVISIPPEIMAALENVKEGGVTEPVKTKEREWEQILGGNWLARIGVLALVIGAGFFLKFAFDQNWLGPTARVILGVIGGLAMAAALIFWGPQSLFAMVSAAYNVMENWVLLATPLFILMAVVLRHAGVNSRRIFPPQTTVSLSDSHRIQ